MVFSVKSEKNGKMYYLHAKEVKLAGGRKQKIFYFASKVDDFAIAKLPAGYEVSENSRTGLPLLKKIK